MILVLRILMAFTLYVETEYPTPEGIYSARAESRARKASFGAMGEKWTDDFLHLHFEPGNETRYQFAPRDDKYLEKKKREAQRANLSQSSAIMAGVRNPVRPVLFDGMVLLVFHGDLSRDVQKSVVIKAFPTRCTIVMGSGVLPYLVEHPRSEHTVNIANEIRQVIPEEREILHRVAAGVYFRMLEGRSGKYIYKVGVTS
jgi:hypothetical protein